MTVQRAGGYIVLALMVAGALGWVIFTVSTGRRGAGSEVELAANRKQYLSDEELETTKLDRSLLAAVGLFFLISLALPFYWLAEGGRQAGAVKAQHEKFVRAGEALYTTGAQCVACHGPQGTGGVASLILNDEEGRFIDRVTWNAPALNTVLWRFSEDEVRYILNYGRPGSPMQPWGVAGGGPYNSQQIDQIIDYLWSIQLPEEKMRTEVDDAVKAVDEDLYNKMVAVREENDEKAKQLTEESGQEKTVLDIPGNDLARLDQQSELWLGEILFSLKAPGAGAYNCSRCHIPGAAYGKGNAPFNDENPPAKDRVDNGGITAMGPNLAGIEDGSTALQHFNLVMQGTQDGKQYFSRRIGSGKMPGFGVNPSAGLTDVPQLGLGGEYTPEQVWAVVAYERSLSSLTTTTSTPTAEAPTTTVVGAAGNTNPDAGAVEPAAAANTATTVPGGAADAATTDPTATTSAVTTTSTAAQEN
jgi:mono/diheme cytochrome c family protein